MSRMLVCLMAFLLQSCSIGGIKKFDGSYFWGVEEEVLVSCGGEAFWLEGSPSDLEPFRDIVRKGKESGSDKPIFVELLATEGKKSTDGFAMDYDGVLVIKKIRLISKNVPDRCHFEDVTENQ